MFALNDDEQGWSPQVRYTNPGQSEEVSIAMGATLGTVNLIQMLQGELELRRERFGPCA